MTGRKAPEFRKSSKLSAGRSCVIVHHINHLLGGALMNRYHANTWTATLFNSYTLLLPSGL